MKDDELIATQNAEQREFWNKIGSTGIAYARQSLIPLQVENENDLITKDIPEVLQKRENDFSELFNPSDNDSLDDKQISFNKLPLFNL